MNSYAKVALYFVGVVLLIAGAVTLGRQFSADQIDAFVPCLLLAAGAGSFGLGLFWPDAMQPAQACLLPGDPHSSVAEAGHDLPTLEEL
jgi:uncharacterized membrane protein HdeD (DUF308 family)